MPPRKAKRVKTSGTANVGSNANSSQPSSASSKEKSATKSVVNNGKCRFVEFPVELLLEIMSYFPAVHIPTSRRYDTPVLPPSVFERWDVLRALSQTCRLWRNIFLPLLWERMEACAIRTELAQPRFGTAGALPQEIDMSDFRGDRIPASWYKGVSRLLEKLSNGLTENPEIAKHVQVVNVSLTRCSPGTVLPAFVKCLENLPNLHTLQIFRAHSAMTGMLNTYFQSHQFPNVRVIILPGQAHEILRCCPEVRKVICNSGGGSKIVTAIAKCCRKVEVLEGIDAENNTVKRLVKACPNLKELSLGGMIEENLDVFTHLMSLKSLNRLQVMVGKNCLDTYLHDPKITSMIKLAKEVLNLSNTQEKKSLTMWYYVRVGDGEITTWTLDIPLGGSSQA